MKQTNHRSQILGFLALNVTAALCLSGCASPEVHSFNADYKENLLTKPVYFIEDKEATSFTITVKEGTPSSGPERITDVKAAAATIASDECQKLGWDKWDLNYIEDHNRGWMHIVVAKVTRK